MKNLAVAKFGGSAIGIDGKLIPIIIKRINELKKDAKVIAVFSAPLTLHDGKQRSLTDIVIMIGQKAQEGHDVGIEELRKPYQKILEFVDKKYQDECKKTIDSFLEKAYTSIKQALQKKEFTDVIRSSTLAYSGEILMSHVMNYILKSNNIKSDVIGFDIWPIITDTNIESANFLASESGQSIK